MVRNEHFKLVVRSNNLEPVEFYDLKNDPNELDNRINDTTLHQIIQQLIDNHISEVLDHPRND